MDERIQNLMLQLTSEDETEREAAAERLARLGEGAQGASAALVRAVGDENESVQQWAAAALEGIGVPLETELSEIAKLVGSEDADIAYWAVTLLGRAGDRAVPHASALVEALDGHWAAQVRQRAAWACGRLGPSAAPVKPALQRAATSPDARLKRLAQDALDQLNR